MLNKQSYGSLLREARLDKNFKNADTFIAELEKRGVSMPKSTLYRIERGNQPPDIEFALAANSILFGDAFSPIIIVPALNELLQSDISLQEEFSSTDEEAESPERRARRYDEIMNGLSEFDFEIFPNGKCDNEHLYISIAYGPQTDDEYDCILSFEIFDESDVERAVIQFLKRFSFNVPGKQIVKLVDYALEEVSPALKMYRRRWQGEAK